MIVGWKPLDKKGLVWQRGGQKMEGEDDHNIIFIYI